jgi:DNA-binding transcriptional regulator YiaG
MVRPECQRRLLPPMTPEEFRARRKALALTQQQLADLLGVTPQAIRNWESGRGHIRRVVDLAMKRLEAELIA